MLCEASLLICPRQINDLLSYYALLCVNGLIDSKGVQVDLT